MATHALIPREWRESLGRIAEATGTVQSRLVADAALLVLGRARTGFTPDTPPMPKGGLVALVVRIPADQQRALHALAERTRIRYSEWLRQAVVDVLREHGAMEEAPPVASEPVEPGERCGCGFRLLPGEGPLCEDCREVAS